MGKLALRRPTLASFPGDAMLDRLMARVGKDPTDLAEPPSGSGLAAVSGERGLPLIGQTINVLRHGDREALRMYDAYGQVYWSGVFGTKMVWAVGPDAVREVLANKGKVYSQSGWEFFIGPFFTRGLMLLDGQEHLLHRRIMQEAFTRPRLESYHDQLRVIIDRTLPTWHTDEPMLMFPAVKSLSLDIARSVFMGSEPDADSTHLIDAFEDTVRAGTGLVRRRVPGLPMLRWNKGLAGRRVLEAHFRGLLPAKRAGSDADLFAALCHVETEDGLRFSDDDVVNHMIFLMMAAHDTSTITASAMIYYLAKHPDWQQRARAESLALAAADAAPGLAALDTLETLDRIFKESMRLVAPVPALVRRTTRDTELLGHYLPEGTMVSVVPGATHKLDHLWTRTDDFEPDRFAEPRQEHKGHRFGYIPFGGGAHKCIGMAFGSAEVKSLVHRLLVDFELEVPEDYEIEWDHTSLAVPTDDFPVTLRRRT